MNCPNCNTENKTGSPFCGVCGTDLPTAEATREIQPDKMLCPKCNASNLADAPFCSLCGENFSEPAPVNNAELATELSVQSPVEDDLSLSSTKDDAPQFDVKGDPEVGQAGMTVIVIGTLTLVLILQRNIFSKALW